MTLFFYNAKYNANINIYKEQFIIQVIRRDNYRRREEELNVCIHLYITLDSLAFSCVTN